MNLPRTFPSNAGIVGCIFVILAIVAFILWITPQVHGQDINPNDTTNTDTSGFLTNATSYWPASTGSNLVFTAITYLQGVTNYDFTEYDRTNLTGISLDSVAASAVALTFTTPSLTNTYIVQYMPWRPSVNMSFVLGGVVYPPEDGPNWQNISVPLTPTNTTYTFFTGIVDDNAYFRIIEL